MPVGQVEIPAAGWHGNPPSALSTHAVGRRLPTGAQDAIPPHNRLIVSLYYANLR